MLEKIDAQHKLIKLIKNAIRQDEALREQYEIGDKFRFVRDRLNAILHTLEKDLHESQPEEKKAIKTLREHEIPVYVYLYNAQGLLLRNWINMLTPNVFYEYSVNRPIYQEKAHIESLIRSKTNKMQHAYLTVAIDRDKLVTFQHEALSKDILGNPLVKVKEGALSIEHLIAFTHNENDYELTDEGELVKKEDQ